MINWLLTSSGLKCPPASLHSFPVSPLLWTWKPCLPFFKLVTWPVIVTIPDFSDWVKYNFPTVPDPFASTSLTTRLMFLSVDSNILTKNQSLFNHLEDNNDSHYIQAILIQIDNILPWIVFCACPLFLHWCMTLRWVLHWPPIFGALVSSSFSCSGIQRPIQITGTPFSSQHENGFSIVNGSQK